MDNKLLVGFLIFLGFFLVFPIAMQQIKQRQAPVEQTAATANSVGAKAASANPELNQPPLLNEGNLIGTNWKMPQGEYTLKVSLAAGGVCYITHPLAKTMTGLDYIEARWRVSNDQAFINGQFGGKEHSYTLKISGNDLYYMGEGTPRKIERFY